MRVKAPSGSTEPPPTINVRPANAAVAKFIKHPTGVGFGPNPVGTAWPADQFTFRRLQDGDIVRA
jgi:hypothetical protein